MTFTEEDSWINNKMLFIIKSFLKSDQTTKKMVNFVFILN